MWFVAQSPVELELIASFLGCFPSYSYSYYGCFPSIPQESALVNPWGSYPLKTKGSLPLGYSEMLLPDSWGLHPLSSVDSSS